MPLDPSRIRKILNNDTLTYEEALRILGWDIAPITPSLRHPDGVQQLLMEMRNGIEETLRRSRDYEQLKRQRENEYRSQREFRDQRLALDMARSGRPVLPPAPKPVKLSSKP